MLLLGAMGEITSSPHMLNIGAGEIAIILVVALLVLGPKRLPELARGIGKFMREFRRQTDEVRTTLETEFYRMDQDLLREDPKPELAPINANTAPEPVEESALAQAKDDPPAPVPQLPPEVKAMPPIIGPLDGGRRVADTLVPRPPPVAAPAPQAHVDSGAAPDAGPGEKDGPA
ncbi:MAG: Sec-independent protein translocase protein TatB [Myxococcaceae bacterium]